MNILFLQNTDDALGGIARVNISLMKAFAERGDRVSLISLRHSGKKDKLEYPELDSNILINEKDIWDCPRYSKAVEYLKMAKVVPMSRVIIKRWTYDRGLKRDYRVCMEEIKEQNPDVIINSHYELLKAIPDEYLPVTVNHFHTSFGQVIKNRSYLKIFGKYKEKIGKFVWLTDATLKSAVEAGFKNSISIYNPLSFSSEKCTSYQQKAIIFLGRFSPEKRLDRAIRIFDEVIQENGIKDWRFDIYGTGVLPEEVRSTIEKNGYIHLCGSTEDVPQVMLEHSLCMMTSEFEGMSLTILEANECGVPVICFDFGESVFEEILDRKTGYIIGQNDEKAYKDCLLYLMRDEKQREKLGRAAKEYVSCFSIDNVADEWYRLFEELTAQSRNRRKRD